MSIKKLIIFVYSMLTISMFIVGCTDSSISADKINPSEIESDYENLVIKDINYDNKNKLISFNVENKGNKEVTTSLHYKIEKYNEKDDWIKTNLTDNLAFIEIAIIIQEYQTSEETIDLSKIDKLSDGYYRIVKNYYDGEDNINGYIRFKVKDEDVTKLKGYNNVSK